MKKILLSVLAVGFLMSPYPMHAQVDTLRGRVPYLHYNYYDSTWNKTKLDGDNNMWCVVPVSAIHNCWNIVYNAPNGRQYCSPTGETVSQEVAIRMEMDTMSVVSGLLFGYNTNTVNSLWGRINYPFYNEPKYKTHDYIFNIYDGGMNLLWSDTVLTEALQTYCYMEAGLSPDKLDDAYYHWYSTNQGGYAATGYIGLCKIVFDTDIYVPDTFFIGVTSTTPITPQSISTDTVGITVTTFAQMSYGYNTNFIPYYIPSEMRRYRIAQNVGEQTLNWEDEQCRVVQTCLYPILVLPCNDVTNLRYEPVGSTGTIAFVQWDGDDNHAGYEISYGPHGTPPGEGTVIQTRIPQAVLSQLDRSTRYDVYVRARCDYDTTRWSAWSDTLHMHIATYGIDDVEAPEVTLAPNPTDGRLAVRCEAPITAVALYDLQGRAVLTARGSGTEAVLDLAALPIGTYVLVAHTAQGQVTRTVEKR